MARNMAILYGGSVKAENAVELAACPDINGALGRWGIFKCRRLFIKLLEAFANTK